MTEFELREFLIEKISTENLDKGKCWGQARVHFQDSWPAGIKREDFNKFYDDVDAMVQSPLLLAAHRLTKLELSIIEDFQTLLKQVDPRDSNHIRDLVEGITAFNKDRLDLEGCCDEAMRLLEDAGVELSDELKVKLDKCWPGANDNVE